MRHRIGYAVIFASALLAVGCAKNEKLDIGDGHDKATVTGVSLSDYAGSWDGYVEAYMFEDGSDRLRLSLDAHGSGSLEVGDAPQLPDPDPDVGYPPSVNDPSSPDAAGKPTFGARPFVYAGFAYPVSGAKVEAKRIRVGTSTHELFRAWCEMQEPLLNRGAFPTSYSCNGGGYGFSGDPPVCNADDENGQPITVDCGKVETCNACECTETACSVSDMIDMQFDAALGGEASDELTGTLLLAGERITVHMARD